MSESAEMNASAGAPASTWRARAELAAKEMRTFGPPAAAKPAAIRSSGPLQARGGEDGEVGGERDAGWREAEDQRGEQACAHRRGQAGFFAPSSSFCSSPVWYISRMMSEPPTNSPFT